MSIPMLTPLETPIFDDLVIAEMDEHFDDTPCCDGATCDVEAVARVVLLCPCRTSRKGCGPHVDGAVEFFASGGVVRHTRCNVATGDYRVVPL